MIETVAEDLDGTPPHAVSVVIPAFNEAAHIAEQVRAVDAILRASGWVYEIIVIDDGSKDDTAGEADRTGLARVIRHIQNRGYGAGLKLGISRARYEWVLITDADGTYPPEAIPELLAVADRNAMVVGARTGRQVAIPVTRKPAKAFLRWLASYLSERPIPDINSGLRLMRKSLIRRYDHLLPNGFSFTTTITLAANCNGHQVEYLPIDYHARLGESKIRPKHAYEFLVLTLRTVVYFNPLKVFVPLGVVLALGGFAKLGVDLYRDNLSESAVLLLLGSLIVWAVGLLADQNAKIGLRPLAPGTVSSPHDEGKSG